jgi:hypothetical protein
MSLLTLPPNLQQAITRLIPHHDLLSLRLTCQYFHGFLPDALLEKPLNWEDTEISLYFRSLLLLHGFSKTSRFRDAIIILVFLKPSGFRDEKAGKWHESGVQREEAYAFTATDEAIYLLAECFRNLVSAMKLEKIDIRTEVGAGSILKPCTLPSSQERSSKYVSRFLNWRIISWEPSVARFQDMRHSFLVSSYPVEIFNMIGTAVDP